jgi:protein gp37
MARRQIAMGNASYEGTVDFKGVWTGNLKFIEKALDAPLHWKRPCRIFVCSMSDIFHPNSEFEKIRKIFGITKTCQARGMNHTFIFLTKRPETARHFFCSLPYSANENIWENLWVGTTVESMGQFGRIYNLISIPRIPVSKLFVSCEPMLGPITLGPIIKKIDWVICGSESGHGARPMNPDWARSLRDQCKLAGVPFFLKQMTWIKTSAHELPELDGRTWGEFPK